MRPGALRRRAGIARSLGLRGAATAVAWWWGREYLVYARDLRRPLPEIPEVGPIRWEPLTEATIPDLRAVDPSARIVDVRRRWAEGQECLLYWHGAWPVYYIWTATGSVYLEYLRRTLHPRPGDYLVVDAFTHPKFRGRGVGALSTVVGLHRATASGCRRWLAR